MEVETDTPRAEPDRSRGHVALADEELASESEEEKPGKTAKAQEALQMPREGHGLTKRRRVRRSRPEVESFLLRFKLGPPEGFPDPGSTDEEGEGGDARGDSPVARAPAPAFAGQPGQATVELKVEGEGEGDEEAELTRRIREKQSRPAACRGAQL